VDPSDQAASIINHARQLPPTQYAQFLEQQIMALTNRGHGNGNGNATNGGAGGGDRFTFATAPDLAAAMSFAPRTATVTSFNTPNGRVRVPTAPAASGPGFGAGSGAGYRSTAFHPLVPTVEDISGTGFQTSRGSSNSDLNGNPNTNGRAYGHGRAATATPRMLSSNPNGNLQYTGRNTGTGINARSRRTPITSRLSRRPTPAKSATPVPDMPFTPAGVGKKRRAEGGEGIGSIGSAFPSPFPQLTTTKATTPVKATGFGSDMLGASPQQPQPTTSPAPIAAPAPRLAQTANTNIFPTTPAPLNRANSKSPFTHRHVPERTSPLRQVAATAGSPGSDAGSSSSSPSTRGGGSTVGGGRQSVAFGTMQALIQQTEPPKKEEKAHNPYDKGIGKAAPKTKKARGRATVKAAQDKESREAREREAEARRVEREEKQREEEEERERKRREEERKRVPAQAGIEAEMPKVGRRLTCR
jgi:hypothetical protein